MFKNAFANLQKVGKSLMLPVSVLPIAGILLGVGSANFSWLPAVVSHVMAEAGVDISGHKSELLSDLMGIKLDYVVTVCGHAHETCPVFPAQAKVVHVGFNDPPKMARELAEKGGSEEEQLACYRRVRDEIKAYIETLPTALTGE